MEVSVLRTAMPRRRLVFPADNHHYRCLSLEKSKRQVPSRQCSPADRYRPIHLVQEAQGYNAGIVGKWHLGLGSGDTGWNRSDSPRPNQIGFDYSYILATFLYYALKQPHVPRTPNPGFVGKSGLGPRGDVIPEAD
ncbi:hypothetical protein SAMN03080598_03782 [Algoriphagus boritolerans DSM 17298 = JCM 18970]|uniref:Sulfatase n=1 Tax=Algoriphagus boritolerans DSM 17298 = JCM 18970 TaxID=1120964 RepID=A0A1H5ZXM6_9BACT|nr:hypothetical protein SAMN03080598_03782 [Algoriphagus boritolerans DSM 17298 = JCM 18970]